MPTDPSRGESSYFMDAESAAEMARLVHQVIASTRISGLGLNCYSLSWSR